jgi:hypothetical protein
VARNGKTEERHRSTVGVRQPEQDANERRLAGAVGPEVPEGAASRNAKVHAIDGIAIAESFSQAARFYGQGFVPGWRGGIKDGTAH